MTCTLLDTHCSLLGRQRVGQRTEVKVTTEAYGNGLRLYSRSTTGLCSRGCTPGEFVLIYKLDMQSLRLTCAPRYSTDFFDNHHQVVVSNRNVSKSERPSDVYTCRLVGRTRRSLDSPSDAPCATTISTTIPTPGLVPGLRTTCSLRPCAKPRNTRRFPKVCQ